MVRQQPRLPSTEFEFYNLTFFHGDIFQRIKKTYHSQRNKNTIAPKERKGVKQTLVFPQKALKNNLFLEVNGSD